MKKGKAPGPSGLSYDILGAMDEEHLDPLVEIVNKALRTGTVEKEINRALMRPLPKTDQGLAELEKTRPIALMENILKLIEKVMFDRIIKVIEEQGMLRKEQHGGTPGRTVKAPIRSLAEIIEDASQTGRELHIFSADIAKAFDSIEYWSQAISWSALGMPKELINMIVQMDKEGETTVILGQGRQSEWYKAGRGVRQGSIGGPIKWVVFINFWIELVYEAAKGQGYRMAEAMPEDEEILGQVFIDDSNWVAHNSEGMENLIQLGEEFTEFHGIQFNKSKCEYMVANQKRNNRNEYQKPRWRDGEEIEPKMRKAKESILETQLRARSKEKVRTLTEEALEYEGIPARNPTVEEHKQIDNHIVKWQEAIETEDKMEIKRKGAELERIINMIKKEVYVKSEITDIMKDTRKWAEDIKRALNELKELKGGKGKSSRYLGVWYEMDHKWRNQRRILQNRFRDMNEKINKSNPNREQAIYCVNAVINAAIKFPLQVAHIPRTVLESWDAKNRETVRKAGAIPKLASGLAHIKKEYGGMGLQSLVTEVAKERVVDQIQWLNSDSTTGQIVRAARRRWEKKRDERHTLQAHTMREMAEMDVEIVVEEEKTRDMWGNEKIKINYQGIKRQAIQDIAQAESNERKGGLIHSFGDGATWTAENRSGWGIAVIHDGKVMKTKNGRLPGKQSNDAAETKAILQGLLETNPRDDMIVYCDNQGCIDIWNRVEKLQENKETNRNNKAMWNRIGEIRKHREEKGARTRIEWVHSHVDDEKRREKGGGGKYKCACGGTREPGQKGCTHQGEEGHWIHNGNEEADKQAGMGAYKQKPKEEDINQGEYPYTIVNANDKQDGPQGKYKEWIEQKQWEKAGEKPSTTRERIENTNKLVDGAATKKMIGNLGSEGAVSWRFWCRVFLECLPTHAQMIKFSKGSEHNIYKEVYRDELGEEGKCIRCGQGKETTLHATYECESVRQRWEYTNHKIQEEWRREGEDWSRVDWTTQEEADKRYPDWNQGMTIAGMVPMGAKEKMQHPGHKATKLINKTVNTILKTAQKVWEERNQAVQEWIDSKPELKERKAQADKTGWKAMPRERQKRKRDKKDGGEGKGERYDRIKEEATEKIEEIRENKRIKAEGEMENIISYCEKHSIVPAHPAARERWTKNRIKEMCKEAEREKRQKSLRAEMAVGTRDLKETEMGSGRMQDTMPTIAIGKRKFHWTPKIGLSRAAPL